MYNYFLIKNTQRVFFSNIFLLIEAYVISSSKKFI